MTLWISCFLDEAKAALPVEDGAEQGLPALQGACAAWFPKLSQFPSGRIIH